METKEKKQPESAQENQEQAKATPTGAPSPAAAGTNPEAPAPCAYCLEKTLAWTPACEENKGKEFGKGEHAPTPIPPALRMTVSPDGVLSIRLDLPRLFTEDRDLAKFAARGYLQHADDYVNAWFVNLEAEIERRNPKNRILKGAGVAAEAKKDPGFFKRIFH